MTAVKLRNLVRKCFKGYKTDNATRMEGSSNPYDNVQTLSFYIEWSYFTDETIDYILNNLLLKYQFSMVGERISNHWRSDNIHCNIQYWRHKRDRTSTLGRHPFYYEFQITAPKKAKPRTLPYYD